MSPVTAQIIQFFSSLAIAIIAFLIKQIFQKRPKLITFYAHASEVTLKSDENTDFITNTGDKITIRSHTIVVGNIGKATANNVKVIHGVLPINYTVFPPVHFKKRDNEITIPTLAPGENISITYLYFKDVHYTQTNLLVKCDECLATAGNMKHVYDLPTWAMAGFYFLLFIGAVTSIYMAIGIILCFYHSCGVTCWI